MQDFEFNESAAIENLKSNEPNEKTLKAFMETEEGIGLVHCENFDDLIAKIGLKSLDF